MNNHNLFKRFSVLILILILGMGLALALPWIVKIQGKAALSGIEPPDDKGRAAAAKYYVATTGDGTAPDAGWETAAKTVQDALDLAYKTGGGDIWIAAGVYYPDEGTGQINDAVSSTFVMTDNVALYGGFDISDNLFTERDWEKNVTVLSGDIDGNDITDTYGVVLTTTDIISDNAYHVVSANDVTGTAFIDGFTITAGQANGKSPFSNGGGFYCDGSGTGNGCSPSLSNIRFIGNWAIDGGAMYNDGEDKGSASPSLKNVRFFNNSAMDGGAMFNFASFGGDSSPILREVTFSGNSARTSGGAMLNWVDEGGTVKPNLVNVLFSGNQAEWGGAMVNYGDLLLSRPLPDNPDEEAANNGIYINSTTRPVLTNVTMSGNQATDTGGGIVNFESAPIVRNSILWNNLDRSGSSAITATIYNENSAISITHSLVQGTGGSSSWILDPSYVDGGNNIDTDPMFITAVDPSTAPTTAGNLHLKSGSPAIDKGNNTFVTGVLTDLDGEQRIVDWDLDGTETVDMGAYEKQIEELYLTVIFR